MFSVLLYDYLSTHSTNEQQLGMLFKIFLSQVLFILPFEIARPKYLKIIAEHGINIPKISLGRNPLFFQEGVSKRVRWMESGKAARAVLYDCGAFSGDVAATFFHNTLIQFKDLFLQN